MEAAVAEEYKKNSYEGERKEKRENLVRQTRRAASWAPPMFGILLRLVERWLD